MIFKGPFQPFSFCDFATAANEIAVAIVFLESNKSSPKARFYYLKAKTREKKKMSKHASYRISFAKSVIIGLKPQYPLQHPKLILYSGPEYVHIS